MTAGFVYRSDQLVIIITEQATEPLDLGTGHRPPVQLAPRGIRHKARDYADYTARSREAYQPQFSLGQRTLLDLLDSENELFTANRRYTEVRYTEEFSMYRVISAMGELLRKQNVVVPAEAVALTEVKSEARLPEMR